MDDNEQDAREKQTYASFGGRPPRLLGDGGHALTFKGFSIVPDFAVREAYLLNLAQAAVLVDREDTAAVLADYVEGSTDFDHTAEQLQEIIDSAAEAATPAEIAATKEG